MVEEELSDSSYWVEQIESSQLTSALDKMHQTGQRLGEVLQSMDVMSESQIYAAIHSQLQYVFRKVLSIRTGQLLSMPSTPYQKFIHGTRLNRYLCLWINPRSGQGMNPQQLLNSLRGVQAQHVAASPMLRQVSATIDWEGQEEDWLKIFKVVSPPSVRCYKMPVHKMFSWQGFFGH